MQAAYSQLNFFDEKQTYWTPASTIADLYSQLASKKYREISREQIQLADSYAAIIILCNIYITVTKDIHLRVLEPVGAGQFGEVFQAQWTISGATKEVAVKTLRVDLPEKEKVKFLQEAAIIGQFFHPNVVKLYGVVTVGEPVSQKIN